MEMKEIKCKNCGSVDFLPGGLNGVGPNLECKHCGTMYVLDTDPVFQGTIDYGPNDFMSATSRGYAMRGPPGNTLGWRARW